MSLEYSKDTNNLSERIDKIINVILDLNRIIAYNISEKRNLLGGTPG